MNLLVTRLIFYPLVIQHVQQQPTQLKQKHGKNLDI